MPDDISDISEALNPTRPIISDGPEPLTDSARLTIALGRLAEAETRAAFSAAGARGEIHRSVMHRVRAAIDDDGRLVIDAVRPEGAGVMSLADLVNEIRSEVPNCFGGGARNASEPTTVAPSSGTVKRYTLPQWQKTVGAAPREERGRLLRDLSAGRISIIQD